MAQGTALKTDLFVSFKYVIYSLILHTIKPQRKMFLCCVVCEKSLPHVLSWYIYQQERQLMTIISFHPYSHKSRDIQCIGFETLWVLCVSIVWKCQQNSAMTGELQRNKCSVFSQNRYLLAVEILNPFTNNRVDKL